MVKALGIMLLVFGVLLCISGYLLFGVIGIVVGAVAFGLGSKK